MIFIAVNCIILFACHLAVFHRCRSLKSSGLAEHLVSTFLLWVVQVTAGIILLGSLFKNLGLPYLIALNLVVSGSVIFGFRQSINESCLYLYNQLRDFFIFLRQGKDYLLYLFLFLFLFQLAATVWKIYFLPPHVRDVLSYHLHPVAEWFQNGEIISYIQSPVKRVNRNPLGSKFFHLWWLAFFKEITWIEVPQFLFGIMLTLSSYALMLKMGIKRAVSMRYAVLIYFLPVVLLQSRTCQDHLVLAACTVTALLFAVDIVFHGRYQQIIFLGLCLSYLIAIKKHAPLVLLIMLPLLLLFLRSNPYGNLRKFLKTHCMQLSASAALVLVSVLYFYFRNPLVSGNIDKVFKRHYSHIPIILLVSAILAVVVITLYKWIRKKYRGKSAPVKQKKAISLIVLIAVLAVPSAVLLYKHRHTVKPFLIGHTTPIMKSNRTFDRQYPAFKSNFAKNVLAFPFRIKDIGLYTSYSPDLLEKSGFGIQFFSFGVLAYLLAFGLFLFKPDFRAGPAGFLMAFSILLLMVYFIIYYTWANYRSFIFFAVIGIILWACLTCRWDFSLYRRYLDILLLLMILFNITVCFFEGNMFPRQWKTTLSLENPHDRTTVKFKHQQRDDAEAWEFIDLHLLPSEPIAFSGGRDIWTSPYYGHRLQRELYYLNGLPGFTAKKVKHGTTTYNMVQFTPALKESLKTKNIHFIHFNYQQTIQSLRLFVDKTDPWWDKEIIKVTGNLYYYK